MSEDGPVEPARSALMARIGQRNSKPEIVVRQLLHAMGYRFRLHAKELPGRPDIVMRPRRKVIFVHGCFWHRHEGCRRTTTPKTRREFWEAKFEANEARDRRVQAELVEAGWRYLVVWECEVKDRVTLASTLRAFVD